LKNFSIRQNKPRLIKLGLLICVIAILYLLPFTGMGTGNAMRIGINIFLYIAMAEMWNLMAGYAGMISLGQQLFIGVSGYAIAVVCTTYGLPFWVGFLVGGVISAMLAFCLSLLLLKMRGMYFAISTWVFAEMVKIIFTGWKLVNYGGGMSIKLKPYPTASTQYLMCLSLCVFSILLVYFLMNSKTGLGLTAMRNDLDAAAGAGVNIFRTRMICFMISGFVTGVASAMFYLFKITIYPNGGFSSEWTIALVVSVIIGGIGTIAGPVIGAIVYVALFNFLANYAGYSNVILGVIAIAVILLLPKGIVGTLQSKLHFELFSSRRLSKE
jgi:branched-chain amino acid transport system permease protein